MNKELLDDNLYEIPLRQMVTFRIARIHARMNAQATGLLKKSAGISLMEWRVLVMLDSHGKITPAEIVRRTGLDKGQLSRTIKHMVTDGLIKSETKAEDQRAHVIDFTDKGRHVFQLARPNMRLRQMALINSLSNEEQEALFHALDKLETVLEELEQWV